MRAPFDTNCKVTSGPAAVPPNFDKGTYDCRLVREDAIATVGAGAPVIPDYLTIEDLEPIGVWVDGEFAVDRDLADRISIPPTDPAKWYVIYTDAVNWKTQAQYYRCYLVKLPKAEIVGAGGMLLGGSASIARRRLIHGAGGMLLGGSASIARRRLIHGAGGMLLGGSASIARRRLIHGAGGLLLGGSASIASSRRVLGEGGILLGGFADVVFTPGVVGTGWLDTFTDTDGTNLASHVGENTPGGYAIAPSDWEIQSNRAVVSSLVGNNATLGYEPGVSDWIGTYTFKPVTFAASGGTRTFALYFRYAITGEHFRIIIQWNPSTNSSSAWQLLYYDGFSLNTLHTGASGFVAGTDMTIVISSDATGIDFDVGGDTYTQTTTDLYSSTYQYMQFLNIATSGDQPSIDLIEVIP